MLGLAEMVPEGVVSFDPANFVGAALEDVARWYAEIVQPVR